MRHHRHYLGCPFCSSDELRCCLSPDVCNFSSSSRVSLGRPPDHQLFCGCPSSLSVDQSIGHQLCSRLPGSHCLGLSAGHFPSYVLRHGTHHSPCHFLLGCCLASNLLCCHISHGLLGSPARCGTCCHGLDRGLPMSPIFGQRTLRFCSHFS